MFQVYMADDFVYIWTNKNKFTDTKQQKRM